MVRTEDRWQHPDRGASVIRTHQLAVRCSFAYPYSHIHLFFTRRRRSLAVTRSPFDSSLYSQLSFAAYVLMYSSTPAVSRSLLPKLTSPRSREPVHPVFILHYRNISKVQLGSNEIFFHLSLFLRSFNYVPFWCPLGSYARTVPSKSSSATENHRLLVHNSRRSDPFMIGQVLRLSLSGQVV